MLWENRGSAVRKFYLTCRTDCKGQIGPHCHFWGPPLAVVRIWRGSRSAGDGVAWRELWAHCLTALIRVKGAEEWAEGRKVKRNFSSALIGAIVSPGWVNQRAPPAPFNLHGGGSSFC